MNARRGRRKEGWSTALQTIIDAVFVYDTLRTGQAARSLVADYVAAARPARAGGRIYAKPDGNPALVPGPRGEVIGELCRLRDLVAAFALLDAYEGDDLRRSLIEVTLADGEQAWAWAYLLADPNKANEGELIASGDWALHLSGG